MHFLKRTTSRDINFIVGYNKYDNLPIGAGEDHDPRLRYLKLYKWIFKFRFKYKYLNKKSFSRFQWEQSYNDHITGNNMDFDEHWAYIKWNPIKHKLPENWPYVFTNPKYEDLIDYIDH